MKRIVTEGGLSKKILKLSVFLVSTVLVACTVGAIKNQEYMDDSFIMNAKDVLFVYTDGLNEAKNTNDEMLGQDRMLKALNLADDDPQELIVSMKKAVNDFANGAQQFDDLTMLAIRYNGI
ncbi:PP2C family protein-serine/threonine phosphatase [Butyrivibrio sp. LC3010]|uniref:PP2C family protein-serine/threonine phosphatase n=1 Tax=Butyrivibrio sp. LC3010 TaxID=1280680 RepID=UPI0004121525|nr:SpoIIE family protein phosphatase [Butyrivibrio sp. LC3010]